MNVHHSCELDVSSKVWADSITGRIFADIGQTCATMTAGEARAFAQQLVKAADEAAPLVAIPTLQSGNDDLVPAEHASLGVAA